MPITAEVTPHHLLLTDPWVAGERAGPLAERVLRAQGDQPRRWHPRYDTAAKVNPPLRTAADSAALVDGLRDGTIDAIATDHAPHAQVDKAVSSPKRRLVSAASRRRWPRCWRWCTRTGCRSPR